MLLRWLPSKRKNTGFITEELLAFGIPRLRLICYFALDEDTQNHLLGRCCARLPIWELRRLDDKNKEKIEHLSALLKVYQTKSWLGRAISRLSKRAIPIRIRSILIPSTSMSSARVRCSTASAEPSHRAVRGTARILPGKRL